MGGILSGTIFVTQMTKKDLRSKFEIKDEKSTAVNEGKVTFSRIEELRMKKNNIETKYTSSQESKITEISDKVSQDELDCVTLEKSIAASSNNVGNCRRVHSTLSIFVWYTFCLIMFLFLETGYQNICL